MMLRLMSSSVSEGGSYVAKYSMDRAGWTDLFAISRGIKAKFGAALIMNFGPNLLDAESALADHYIKSASEFKPTLELAKGITDVVVGSTRFTELQYFGPTEGHSPSEWFGHITLGAANGARVNITPCLPRIGEVAAWPAGVVLDSGVAEVEIVDKLLADLVHSAA